MMDLGRIGVFTLAFDNLPVAEVRTAVTELEELGYGAVWVPELVGREALTHASVLLAATERIVVANGIARIGDRTPRATAAGQRTLADGYPGRYLLGLGVGRPKADGPKPLDAMRAYLDEMDAVESSAPEPKEKPARVLAAYGPAMMRLAAERAAGAHTYLVTVEHTAGARGILGLGPILAVEQAVVLERDPNEARRVARDHLGYYLKTPQNLAKLRRLGYSEEDFGGGGSDRLADALVVWGGIDQIAARIRAHVEAGADHVCIQVIGVEPGDAIMSRWKLLAEALLS